MNIFYAPELQVPPMDPECTITFSFIVSKEEKDAGEETQRVTFTSGPNRDISPEHWEKIAEKEVAIQMLKTGALRIMESADDEPEVLKPGDLTLDPSEVKLEDLSVKDAVETVSRLHDVRILTVLKEKELRTPVRAAISRRITSLGA